MPLSRLITRARRALHDPSLPIWYAAQYRLPITGLEHQRGLEPRRADLAVWSLLAQGAVKRLQLQDPPRARYADLCRVHDPVYLETLTRPEPLARIFAAEPWDVPVDEVIHSIRLATGGTVAAMRAALVRRGPALNLLGGFHHAFPDKGGGLCPVNDIAVAIAVARGEGLVGQVVILDLDAHPPDGTAACVRSDDAVWLGSISGVSWGALGAGVDDIVLPGADDQSYLAALELLLGRMPAAQLAFVIAGGDVLAGDRQGGLEMSLDGAQERDLMIAEALNRVPTVWVPGGGYTSQAWRLLAGTGMVLSVGRKTLLPERADPLSDRFASVARRLDPVRLMGQTGDGETDTDAWITEEDLADVLGMPGKHAVRLLGYYTSSGLEYGLFRYGLLDHVRRLGYDDLRVEVDRVGVGDRFRLFGHSEGEEYVLTEGVFARETIAPPAGAGPSAAGPSAAGPSATVLFVHWLCLRHPRGHFSAARPQLPGQDAPGQGTAKEAGQVMGIMADRLGLDGVGHRPSWYHVAYVSRYHFRFVDPTHQGRFEALVRDLASLPLLDATRAVASGRVRLDGEVYAWEPELMVAWRKRPVWAEDTAAVTAELERAHFVVVDQAAATPPPPPAMQGR